MRRRLTYFIGVLAVSLACCGAPAGQLAFADDGGGSDNLSARLDNIASAVSGVESEVMGLRVDLEGHATDEGLADLRADLEALSPNVQALADYAASRSEIDASRHDELVQKLDSIDGHLQQLVTISTPEQVEDDQPPYMTLEGIGQLLMLADGLLAVLVGSRAFSALWRVLAGER